MIGNLSGRLDKLEARTAPRPVMRWLDHGRTVESERDRLIAAGDVSPDDGITFLRWFPPQS
jgi:hypothetical protein